MRVRVYRNLHRDCLSVQHYIDCVGWRVREHVKAIALTDITFQASAKVAANVVKTGRKTVHAYVCGERFNVVDVPAGAEPAGRRVSYRPQVGYFYFTDTGEPAEGVSPFGIVTTRGAYVPHIVDILGE